MKRALLYGLLACTMLMAQVIMLTPSHAFQHCREMKQASSAQENSCHQQVQVHNCCDTLNCDSCTICQSSLVSLLPDSGLFIHLVKQEIVISDNILSALLISVLQERPPREMSV
jgi:hypothetical protein